jgi:hypothetical protein
VGGSEESIQNRREKVRGGKFMRKERKKGRREGREDILTW